MRTPICFKDGRPVHIGDVLYATNGIEFAKFTVTGYSDGVIDSEEWGTCSAKIEELTWDKSYIKIKQYLLPYQYISSSFESHTGLSWDDHDLYRYTSIWAAAWKAAIDFFENKGA